MSNLVRELQQPVGGRVGVMGNWVGCKLAGRGGLVGRGGVDWGLVIVLLVLASEVVERVKASHKLEAVCMGQERLEVVCMGQEKVEVVCMELEKEREGGRSFLQDLPDEKMECIRERAQQRDGRTEVVESGLRKGDGAPWGPDGDWTPQDG